MVIWLGRTGRAAIAATAAAILVAAILVAAPATAATWPQAAGHRGWTLRLAIQYLPGHHSQYPTVLAWRRQAWFLGGSDIGGHGVPEIERRAHGRWTPVPLSSIPSLHSWIAAASATSASDIWAVTALGGAVLHWNGRSWTLAQRGGWQAGTQFTGISALSRHSVWLFGVTGRHHPGAGTWHWDGTGWTRVRGIAGVIAKASALSAASAWAIGEAAGAGALLRLAGGSWRLVSPPALAGFAYTAVAAFSPGNVWVAGSVAGVPKLGHFDGTTWTRLTMPGKRAARGLCRDGSGGLWVIANPATGPAIVRERSAAGHWARLTVSQDTASHLLACALVPGTRAAWGAGQSAGLRGSAAAAYGIGGTP
jgi:hypothetical protein